MLHKRVGPACGASIQGLAELYAKNHVPILHDRGAQRPVNSVQRACQARLLAAQAPQFGPPRRP